MSPVKKTGISSWLDRQIEAAEDWGDDRVGGGIEKIYKDKRKAEAEENAFDSPTLRAYGQMIGAGVKNKQGVIIGSGLRENKGKWEAMIGGRWRKVPDPKTYFQQKSKERWGEEMPEDKKKSAGAAKSGSAGEKNAKGGDKYAEDDFPIQGMNPTSGPLGGGMPQESPSMLDQGAQEVAHPGSPTGQEDIIGKTFSGQPWVKEVLDRTSAANMPKVMEYLGKIWALIDQAGQTGGGDVMAQSQPPSPSQSPSPQSPKPSPPPPPGM